MSRDRALLLSRFFTLLLAVVALLLVAAAPSRGLSEWTQLGPDGGDVSVLEASSAQPGLVFAGLAAGGIFRSEDGGATWEPAREGVENAVFDLATHPSDPDTVYAVTSDGILVSHDRGATWMARNEGLPSLRGFQVNALAIAPSAPDTLYAGTSQGVWKSIDGGASWRRTSSGLPDGGVPALAVHPSDPNTVLAGVGTLYKTTDGGAHWNPSGTGLGQARSDPSTVDVAYSRTDPSTVYALTEDPAYAGVSVSTDGGATWSPTGEDLRNVGGRSAWRPRALAVVEGNGSGSVPELVAAGRTDLFHSSDGGATWSKVTEGVSGQESDALAADPFTPGRVLVGFEIDGVFRSEDGGWSWRPSSAGLSSRPLAFGYLGGPGTRGLVIDPRGTGHLYALGRAGSLFASADWGLTWQGLQGRFDPGTGGGFRVVRDLWLDPTRPRVLFASVQFAPQGGEPSRVLLFRSTDAGETWKKVGGGLPVLGGPDAQFVGALHWDPRGRTGSAGPLFVRIQETAFKSTDDGSTWSVWLHRLPGPIDRLAPTGSSKTLFVWNEEEVDSPCTGFCPPPPQVAVLYVTYDGGNSWQKLDSYVEEPPEGDRRVFVDPRNPSTLYTLRDGDIDRSTDGGATFVPYLVTPFEPLGARPEEGRAAEEVADPVAPGVRYRSGYDGPERSTDGGKTWAPFADGLLATIPVRGVVLPAQGPRVLFASTEAGVWARSLDDTVYPPENVPPPGEPITTPAFPGFRFWVRIVPSDGQPVPTRREAACIPETLCVSGALPGRSEVFVRIVGPKANGYLWPTLVKLTTSAVDVWIERTATDRLRHYHLDGALPGHDVLPGLFDREGFPE